MDTIHVSSFGGVTFDLYATEPQWDLRTRSANLHEPWVIAALQRFIRPGDNCIDAGANVGFHTIVMARLIGPAGSVLAVEPDPRYFKQLNANLALNSIGNVDTLPVCLWDEWSAVHFTSVEWGGASCVGDLCVLTGARSERIWMNAVSLDSLLSPRMPIRALKIDCEGAEGNILRGAKGLLQRGVDCIVCELHNDRLHLFKSSQYSIRAYMAELGYDCYLLTEDCQRPQLLAPEIDIFHDRATVTASVLFAKRETFNAA